MGGEFVEPPPPTTAKKNSTTLDRNYAGGTEAKYKVTQLTVQAVCTLLSEIAIAAGKQEAYGKNLYPVPKAFTYLILTFRDMCKLQRGAKN